MNISTTFAISDFSLLLTIKVYCRIQGETLDHWLNFTQFGYIFLKEKDHFVRVTQNLILFSGFTNYMHIFLTKTMALERSKCSVLICVN